MRFHGHQAVEERASQKQDCLWHIEDQPLAVELRFHISLRPAQLDLSLKVAQLADSLIFLLLAQLFLAERALWPKCKHWNRQLLRTHFLRLACLLVLSI